MNFIMWNNTIYGLAPPLLFILSFGYSFVIAVQIVKNMKSKWKFLFFFIVLATIIKFSFLSLKIGQKQAENRVEKLKIAVDKYYLKHKNLPKNLIELKNENLIKDFNRPIFLIPNGKFSLNIDENSNDYYVALNVKNALCSVSMSKSSDTPYYSFDN